MTRTKIFDILGYIGIALIQGATFPAMLQYILGDGSTALPPLSMTFMVWGGLTLFLFRSIDRKDMVAIISNAIGFTLQSVMLAIITMG